MSGATINPPRAPSFRGQSRTTPAAPSPTTAGPRSPWSAVPSQSGVGGVGEKLKMQKTGERVGARSGTPTTHPLKRDWTVYYVHRPPGSKVIEYEKEIKRVASFGSTESFWPIYAHLASPSALPPVTDLLLFASRIRRPVWEELPNGGKWVLRLRKGVADRLWEDAVLALIGDQFEEEDGIVGMVLSSRSQEDILSVWSDREGDNVATVKDKLFGILGLPSGTAVDYKSNKALLESATQKTNGHSHYPPNGESNDHERDKDRHTHGHGGYNSRHHPNGRGAPERRQTKERV